MCGLAGVFNIDGASVDPGTIEAMSRRLVHRGPDDQGWAFFNTCDGRMSLEGSGNFNLALASRRLSILDLSPAGRMPMAGTAGRTWVVYNGEIYNYRELRAELEALGLAFRTETDTEVILKAYEAWGLDCLSRFNGMWAFALYDAEERRLFCSRDRFGIKPLYYYFDGRSFVFGSEIKAVLAHPAVTPRPNLQAIFNYLGRSYRFVDGLPTTFFEDIRQIEPGTSLMVSEGGLAETRYWALDPQRKTDYASDEEYIERYRELLEDSVRLRLRADVAVAAQLSGGLDSSAVAALAARRSNKGLPVFSACYEAPPFDEREYIEPTVQAIGAIKNEVFPRPEDLPGVLAEMIRAFDEPVCTVTFFAHWQVMAEVHSQGYKVILNGHGADELAAGYYYHFLMHFGDLRAAGANGLLDREIEAWLRNHGTERRAHLNEYLSLLDSGVPYMTDYLKFFKAYDEALGPALDGADRGPLPDGNDFDSLLSNRLHAELTRETLPAVLKAEDRTTMAHSIESRLPFLDYRLVEFLFSTPNNLKIRNGLLKYIQREALNNVIPEKVRTRLEKVGFNAPSEAWFRGPLKETVEEMVSGSSLFSQGFLNRPRFERVWAEHQSGAANHYQFLWQVINLELWLREYF